MPSLKINNGMLWEMMQDVENIKLNPALAFFLRKHITEFNSLNKKQIELLKKSMDEFAQKYVEKNEDGSLKILELPNGEKAYAHESHEIDDEHNAAIKALFEQPYNLRY